MGSFVNRFLTLESLEQTRVESIDKQVTFLSSFLQNVTLSPEQKTIRAYWSKRRVETTASFQNHPNLRRESHNMVLPQTFPYRITTMQSFKSYKKCNPLFKGLAFVFHFNKSQQTSPMTCLGILEVISVCLCHGAKEHGPNAQPQRVGDMACCNHFSILSWDWSMPYRGQSC